MTADAEAGDVVRSAWMAAGAPQTAEQAQSRGPCARCGRQPAGARVADVVSKNFTAHDTWLHPAGQVLCQACAWAYTTPPLRAHAHLVTRDPAGLAQLTRAELAGVLTRGVGAGEALSVPLRAGRKHVLPIARWGLVAVDDVCLAWDQADAARLETVRDLRSRGVSAAALTAAGPPWRVLRSLPLQEQAAMLEEWERLRVWRAQRLWLDLALLATA